MGPGRGSTAPIGDEKNAGAAGNINNKAAQCSKKAGTAALGYAALFLRKYGKEAVHLREAGGWEVYGRIERIHDPAEHIFFVVHAASPLSSFLMLLGYCKVALEASLDQNTRSIQ